VSSPTSDPRQLAYDAVFEEIRKCGSAAAISAFTWRCVHAALNAANVGEPVDPQSGQRFADKPTRLIDAEVDPEEFEAFKARWREQHQDPQAVMARWLGAEVEEESDK
jgi:hypothetical protein